MSNSDRVNGIRLRGLRLTGTAGADRSYGVSFLDTDSISWRPLSVIAGPSQTGKTSIIEFVLYCLGDKEHPQHPEIVRYVRAALLETALSGETTTIERSATGAGSQFASLWNAPIRGLRDSTEFRLPTEPPSEPQGLSQYVLAACDLDNISLPEAPTKAESGTHMLSVRDLFRVIWLPNERLDSKNLVYEHANYMVRQKLRQTIDVMFDVHDAAGTDMAARARQAAEAAREASRIAASVRDVVQAEYPAGPLVLETDRDQARQEAQRFSLQLESLDRNQTSAHNALLEMREALYAAQRGASAAAVRVRNRESLMERLTALRGQYADDKKKLTFLKEAERLFNPLQVSVCPACLSRLSTTPTINEGVCSLCGNQTTFNDGDLTLETVSDSEEPMLESEATGGPVLDDIVTILEAEYRATSRRLEELNDYWNRLDNDLKTLRAAQDEADRAVAEVSAALNQAADVPAPYLAARDDLNRRRAAALAREQAADAGLRLWERVRMAENDAERLLGQAARLRAEQREVSRRPDRSTVIGLLSRRFGEILSDIGYPKLSEPLINDDLKPSVRGLPYTAASSGGLVLISLAWYLSVWQVSYEEGARTPGLLLIDSPQKNLGRAARRDDPDFADARLVENFYRHVKTWLDGPGVGAQLVVVDNSPPDSVGDDVIVRYTRDPDVPPYGLIDNATD